MPTKQRTSNGNGTKRGNNGNGFQPGKSGNPKGRPKFGTSIREIMSRRINNEDFVDRVIQMAMDGHPTALKEVLERLDGKVLQGIENSGEQVWKIVDDR